MQCKENWTRADLVASVPEWFEYSGPAGLKGEYGQTDEHSNPVWITRVPSTAREDGYAYTIYDAAAWRAFSGALTRAGGRELLHA